MKNILIIVFLVVMGAVHPIVAAEWYGNTCRDLEEVSRYAGKPLKVKARFVRALSSNGRKSRREFLVEAAGGEIRCEIAFKSPDASSLDQMKPATPVILQGTTDAKEKIFLVKQIIQGWMSDAKGGIRAR